MAILSPAIVYKFSDRLNFEKAEAGKQGQLSGDIPPMY
jgi:hypothetical protein